MVHSVRYKYKTQKVKAEFNILVRRLTLLLHLQKVSGSRLLLETSAFPDCTFYNLLCRSRGAVKLFYVVAVTIQRDRSLQQCAELHFSLTSRDWGEGGHIDLCISVEVYGITKSENL
jgi:hypothetical protein